MNGVEVLKSAKNVIFHVKLYPLTLLQRKHHKGIKGHVKLIQHVKIAHSFLHVMSKPFPPPPPYHFQLVQVVLNLTVREFLKPTAKTGEMAIFFIYSHFQPIMNVGLSIQMNCFPKLKKDLVLFSSVCSNCKSALHSY